MRFLTKARTLLHLVHPDRLRPFLGVNMSSNSDAIDVAANLKGINDQVTKAYQEADEKVKNE